MFKHKDNLYLYNYETKKNKSTKKNLGVKETSSKPKT